MIAFVESTPAASRPSPEAAFLKMLPSISRQAEQAFYHRGVEARQELVQQVVATAYCAFCRLIERGREDVAFASTLADYAIRHTRCGRQIGCRTNSCDVTAKRAQRIGGFYVESLSQRDSRDPSWQEALAENRKAGPAETAAARIDVAAWFAYLEPKKRQVAHRLARGEATTEVADTFGISKGRVSQLRRELQHSWEVFQGEQQV